MSALQIIAIVVCLATTVVAIALLTRTVNHYLATFRLGQPEDRGDNKGERTRTLLREFLGHTRMARLPVVAIAHWVTMIGFGYLFLTLDPSRILGPGEFERRMDALIRDVHASQTAPGIERVMVPGEIEYRRRAERLANGIPMMRGQLDDLGGLARELSVPVLPY